METQPQVPLQQQSHKGPLQKAIRVLSIDGGGIRGVGVAKILEGIERDTGKRIHELFDVIVGTSTGGLLSVMMGVEIPLVPEDIPLADPKEEKERQKQRKLQIKIREDLGLKPEDKFLTGAKAAELYKLKAKEIFHEKAGFIHTILDTIGLDEAVHLFQSKYEKGDGLQEVVRDLYINNDFCNALTCLGVVVTERGFGTALLLNSTNAKVKAEHNYHNNLSLVQLIRATSAAPTYFNPIHVHNPLFHTHKGDVQAVVQDVKEVKEEEIVSASFWEEHSLDSKICERKLIFFEDGGVACNNPSVKAFKYAKELLKLKGEDHHQYQFQLYSIGTGSHDFNQNDPAKKIVEQIEKSGKVQSGNWDTLIRLVATDPFQIDRLAYKNHIKVQQKLKGHGKKKGVEQKYFRLQFALPDDVYAKMDDSSDKNINILLAAGQECVDKNPEYKNVVEALKVEVDRPQGLVHLVPKI